jgi:hypothetical protein
MDPAANVYLLDAAANLIRVFDKQGKTTATFGRAGPGPGELGNPQAMVHDGAESLYLLDSENGLSVFRTANGHLTHRATHPLDGLQGTDLCLMHDRLLIYGLRGKNTIHEFTLTGRHVRSFGDSLFGPPGTLVQRIINEEGRIACFPERRIVAVAARITPEVRAYSVTTAKVLWTASPPGFVPMNVETFDGGRYRLRPGKDWYAEQTVLRPLNDDVLLVQARRASDLPVLTFGEIITTCLITLVSGACAVHTDTMPLLRAVSGRHAVAVQDTLYPVVRMIEITDHERRAPDRRASSETKPALR